MIFSLFKDKKTIQLANQLATTFIRAATILKKIPKDKTHYPSANALENHNKLVFRK